MAKWSEALRNYIDNYASVKASLSGGKFCLYQGTMPTDPDDAIVGTLLCTITTGSGTLTAPVAPRWSAQMTVDGTVSAFTINSIPIIGSSVAATGTIATTVANIVTAINAYNGAVRYKAWASASDTIVIEGVGALGTTANSFAISITGGTWTTKIPTDATAGSRVGVAHANGLQFGAASSGVMTTSGTWSGAAIATGIAQFFVYYANPGDDTGLADASPWHCRRIIGTCGTSSSNDYTMGSTSITLGYTHTIDPSTLTMEETA